MYRNMKLTFTILGLLILTTGSVLSQGYSGDHGNLTDALRAELERTDQLIERAKEAVQASQAPVAWLNLEAAIDLQAQAWRAFENEYPRLALRLTKQAREKAKKAIAVGRMNEQSEHVVLTKLERTAEMLERARELLIDHTDNHFQAILQSARDNLDKAWEFYRLSQFRAALMLANQAEKALDKLIRTSDRDLRNRLNFERRAEATQQLLERARSLHAECTSPSAEQMARHALEAFDRANRFAANDKFQAAIQALQRSRKMATQALRECRGDDALVRRYERLKNEFERLTENVAPSDDRGQKFLEMASEQLRLAEEALNNNRSQTAAAALKATDMTLSQLKRYLDAR
jgi:hypothetical protein